MSEVADERRAVNLFTRGPVIHYFIRHTARRDSIQVGNAAAASDASVGSDRRGCDNNSAVFLFLCSHVKRQAGWAEGSRGGGCFLSAAATRRNSNEASFCLIVAPQ